MSDTMKAALSKVPEVALGFWIIKIIATTIGETGGDAVTMSWLHADRNAHNGGYLIGVGIFMSVFIVAVIAQILMKKFHPAIYWITIVATTTRRHGDGGFRRPLARDRLRRRFVAPARFVVDVAS